MGLGNITTDIQESICQTLGRKSNFQLVKVFNIEIKPNKTEVRVVVLTEYSIHVLTTKLPVKVEHCFHFVDITSITSSSPNQMVISAELNRKKLTLYQVSSCEDDREREEGEKRDLSDIDMMINYISESFITVFPGSLRVLLGRISLLPESRLTKLVLRLEEVRSKQHSPCSKYASAYHCMCSYHDLPYFEEVVWDVNTIYQSQLCKDFVLNDFDHLDARFLVSVISALMFNDWFTQMTVSNMKLTNELLNEIIKIFETNSCLQRISFINCGLKWEFLQKLMASLLSNAHSAVKGLDLSGNLVEDRGLGHLLPFIEKTSLTSLNLSRNGLTSKGVNQLMASINTCLQAKDSLELINLSNNCLKCDDVAIENLFTFISKPNCLSSLSLSGTDISLDTLIKSLTQGCLNNLVSLDLSHNPNGGRRITKDAQHSTTGSFLWREFFSKAVALRFVNLSSNRLPLETLRQIFTGLSLNDGLSCLELNLCGNALGSAGAKVLECYIGEMQCIESLDISDNGLNQCLGELLIKVGCNSNIRKLAVGKNINSIKPKSVSKLVDAFIRMILDEHSKLEVLLMDDLKLKSDLVPFINAVGCSNTLTELDISGNQMGDTGARVLSKMLLVNKNLSTLHWDRNNITIQGYTDIATALERNWSLKKIFFPVADVAHCTRVNYERTENSLKKIESLLQRNCTATHNDMEHACRLENAFFSNSIHKVMNNTVVKLHDVIDQLQTDCLSEETQEEVGRALGLLNDAAVSSQLFMEMLAVASRSNDAAKNISARLQSVFTDLQSLVEKHIETTTADLFTYMELHCPSVCNYKLKNELKPETVRLSHVPNNFVESLVAEHLKSELMNKLGQFQLTIANQICSRFMEELTIALESSAQSLRAACDSTRDERVNEPTVDLRYHRKPSFLSSTEVDTDINLPVDISRLEDLRKSLRHHRHRPSSKADILENSSSFHNVHTEKAYSTSALIPDSKLNKNSMSDGCKPPVAVFRKRTSISQVTSSSCEILTDDKFRSSGCMTEFPARKSNKVQNKRYRNSVCETSGRLSEDIAIPTVCLQDANKKSSDSLVYHPDTDSSASELAPNISGDCSDFESSNQNNISGSQSDSCSRSRSPSLLSAMLATSAASIAMITMQGNSSSNSNISKNTELESNEIETKDSSGIKSNSDQVGAMTTENQISNQTETNVPTENKREEDLNDFLDVLESTASKLLHPVKDRPKHPKTRPTPSVVGACAAVQSEKATKITPSKKDSKVENQSDKLTKTNALTSSKPCPPPFLGAKPKVTPSNTDAPSTQPNRTPTPTKNKQNKTDDQAGVEEKPAASTNNVEPVQTAEKECVRMSVREKAAMLNRASSGKTGNKNECS